MTQAVSQNIVDSLNEAKKGIEKMSRNVGINLLLTAVVTSVLAWLGQWVWVFFLLGFDATLSLALGLNGLAAAIVWRTAISLMKTLYEIEQAAEAARKRQRIEQAVKESRRPF